MLSNIFGRITSQTFTLMLAFLLSYALLIGIGLTAADLLAWMLDGAEIVEDALTHTNLPNQYNNLLRIFVDDSTILVLFFAIIARILIALIGGSISAAMSPKT